MSHIVLDVEQQPSERFGDYHKSPTWLTSINRGHASIGLGTTAHLSVWI